MSLRVWLLFVVTEAVLSLTLGPAVLFVVSCGLARGGRAALWANAGILSGNTFYFVVSAFGLGAVLLGSHEIFTTLLPVRAFVGALAQFLKSSVDMGRALTGTVGRARPIPCLANS